MNCEFSKNGDWTDQVFDKSLTKFLYNVDSTNHDSTDIPSTRLIKFVKRVFTPKNMVVYWILDYNFI